jgi:hypothetical protein
MGYYVHHVPGRLRVRIPQLKQYPRRIEKVRKAFECIGGIDCIEHKRTTGSVVVHYDPELMDDGRILNILSYNGLFDEALRVSSVEENRKAGVFDEALRVMAQDRQRIVFVYVHHVPNSPAKYPRRIEKVRKAFECIGGIDCIEHKRTTGSVVVHYDSSWTTAAS